MSLKKFAKGEVKILQGDENNIAEFELSVRDMTRELLNVVDPREDCYNKGRFPFVGFPTDQLIVLLHQIAEIFHNDKGRYPESFIDLGCGIGNILIVAKQLGYKVSGVEINPEYVKVCKEHLPDDNIVQDDLWTWEPKEEVDIIFMYKPFHNEDLWTRFIRRLVDLLPDNQYIMSSLSMEMFTFKISPFFIPELELVSPSIYKVNRQRKIKE